MKTHISYRAAAKRKYRRNDTVQCYILRRMVNFVEPHAISIGSRLQEKNAVTCMKPFFSNITPGIPDPAGRSPLHPVPGGSFQGWRVYWYQ